MATFFFVNFSNPCLFCCLNQVAYILSSSLHRALFSTGSVSQRASSIVRTIHRSRSSEVRLGNSSQFIRLSLNKSSTPISARELIVVSASSSHVDFKFSPAALRCGNFSRSSLRARGLLSTALLVYSVSDPREWKPSRRTGEASFAPPIASFRESPAANAQCWRALDCVGSITNLQ